MESRSILAQAAGKNRRAATSTGVVLYYIETLTDLLSVEVYTDKS